MFQAQNPMSEIHMGGWFEEEYLLGYDKYVSNTRSSDYDDLPSMCIINVQGWWNLINILGKAATTALNVLQLLSWPHLCWENPWTVLSWLPQLTEKLEKVSDRICTQVKAQMINKCRNKMTQGGIYNVRDPPWEGDWKNKKKNTVAIWVVSISNWNQFI